MLKYVVAFISMLSFTLAHADYNDFLLPAVPTKASCLGHKQCLKELPVLTSKMTLAFEELQTAHANACLAVPLVISIVPPEHPRQLDTVQEKHCNFQTPINVYSQKAMQKYSYDVLMVVRSINLGLTSELIKNNFEKETETLAKLVALSDKLDAAVLAYRDSYYSVKKISVK